MPDGGKGGRHVRKVVLALRDDLIHAAFLERSGVCTRRRQESKDDEINELDFSWHGGGDYLDIDEGIENECG